MMMLAIAGCNHENLELIDLNGRQIDPLQATDAKAIVFLFTRTDCPISNRYAPEVGRLDEKFSPRGVKFYLVYPNPDATAESIRKHLDEYGYKCAALRDSDHALVQRTAATVTPEAAVFDDQGKMVYRGRIDDRAPKFGVLREPSTHDLEDALEETLAGRPVEVATTRAVGCYISDLK